MALDQCRFTRHEDHSFEAFDSRATACKRPKTPLFKSPRYKPTSDFKKVLLFRGLRANGAQRDGDATRRVVSEIVGFPAHALKLARKLTELLPHQAPE